MITSFNNFKYYSFISYNPDCSSNPPRRFITIIGKRRDCYNFYLKFCGVLKQPTSIYRDVDCWKVTRPYFSLKKEEYKKQREEFFGKPPATPYRDHIFATDYVIDLDANNPYDLKEFVFKLTDLLKKFKVMYCIIFSGKKGFQILIPHNYAIKKEFFDVDGVEHNTHETFALNLKDYLQDKDNFICMSIYHDLRFVKQQFSLDGRNGTPLIPLTDTELHDFFNYEGKYNKYLDYNYWNNIEDFTKRGYNFSGFENMNKLDEFLDNHINEKYGVKDE
jgi:hypothetical protein